MQYVFYNINYLLSINGRILPFAAIDHDLFDMEIYHNTHIILILDNNTKTILILYSRLLNMYSLKIENYK